MGRVIRVICVKRPFNTDDVLRRNHSGMVLVLLPYVRPGRSSCFLQVTIIFWKRWDLNPDGVCWWCITAMYRKGVAGCWMATKDRVNAAASGTEYVTMAAGSI
ncbi:hypothetical protein KCP75_23515 [Salmonella enterica subsp. enterica]|nr:hypothetical protein KCP75_23515 [Salmonella enterica subsp. enterica]